MSGGGGGIIIIRKALQTALTDPLVHGKLPKYHTDRIDPFIETDVDTWTPEQQKTAFRAFEWSENHC